MAGAIPKMVNLVNRTTGPLDGMFDGQPIVLSPGYKIDKDTEKVIGAGPGGSVAVNPMPYWAAEMIKRQNPLMGTEDPNNPRDFESLCGVAEWGDDVDPVEQSEAIERIDRELLDDEAAGAKTIRTSAGRKSAKGKRRGGRAFSDSKLMNPTGIRANYE